MVWTFSKFESRRSNAVKQDFLEHVCAHPVLHVSLTKAAICKPPHWRKTFHLMSSLSKWTNMVSNCIRCVKFQLIKNESVNTIGSLSQRVLQTMRPNGSPRKISSSQTRHYLKHFGTTYSVVGSYLTVQQNLKLLIHPNQSTPCIVLFLGAQQKERCHSATIVPPSSMYDSVVHEAGDGVVHGSDI